jgi:hypothetical protein
LLRIPAAGDKLPPLVLPLKGAASEGNELNSSNPRIKTPLRKKKHPHGGGHAWDQKLMPDTVSELEENRQMFWMLMGGAMLFLLVVGVLAIFGVGDLKSRQLAGAVPPVFIKSKTTEMVPSSDPQKLDAALLAQAKLLVGQFLDARRIEEMLPLVRNPQVAEARMRSHYPGGEIEASGLMEFNTAGGLYKMGSSFEVKVRTRDGQDRALAFCETPEGIKIDWESWVGWSEMPWEEFMDSKPTTGKLFRVLLEPVSYYNFAFSDEQKWNAYRLESPDGQLEIYGYAGRNSELASDLKLPLDKKQSALTLLLKFPAAAKADNQVIIEKIIANGWLLETVKTP